MTKLQQLMERIQELVPEIMELKFGCEIDSGGNIFLLIGDSTPLGNVDQTKRYYLMIASTGAMLESEILKRDKILGRDINLEDVLKALGSIEDYWTSFLWTGDRYAFTIDRAKNNKVLWQLGKPLHLQSEETINFLFDLLCEK